MKSIKKNQKLTTTEKKEAQKYNEELYNLFDIKLRCVTVRDYYLIKSLYLLSQIPQDPEIEKTYRKILKYYYNDLEIPKKKRDEVIDRTLEDYYFNYGFTEGLYQYWFKYYYPTCLNFTSFLALSSGDLLDYVMFDNACKRSLDKFDKFMEEQSIEMVRNEMTITEEILEDDEEIEELIFIWRAKKDEKTCKICTELDNKRFTWAPGLAHPNCRCHLEVRIVRL